MPVTVVTSPDDYDVVMDEMSALNGAVSAELRRRLAAVAFARTAAYDAAIADWLSRYHGDEFPLRLGLAGKRALSLRYGENPHQRAALYVTSTRRSGVARATQLQGKELSYNNINDTDAAFELVAEFDPEFDGPAIAIIKHANPSGVAVGDSLAEAYFKALTCDPISAFGGVVAANQIIDAATAQAIAELFCEVVIAPDVTPEARAVLSARKNLRLLVAGDLPDPQAAGLQIRSVAGGFRLRPAIQRASA